MNEYFWEALYRETKKKQSESEQERVKGDR